MDTSKRVAVCVFLFDFVSQIRQRSWDDHCRRRCPDEPYPATAASALPGFSASRAFPRSIQEKTPIPIEFVMQNMHKIHYLWCKTCINPRMWCSTWPASATTRGTGATKSCLVLVEVYRHGINMRWSGGL